MRAIRILRILSLVSAFLRGKLITSPKLKMTSLQTVPKDTLASNIEIHGSRYKSATNTVPLRILPLGDSITWGFQPDHQVNGTNGYRAQLLSRLASADYKDVTFVGTQRSGNMSQRDHEGYCGFMISQIARIMDDGLALKPNVILLHAGTNDMNRPELTQEKWVDAPKRLERLLEKIYEAVPDAVVLVAKIVQASREHTKLNIRKFNEEVPRVVESGTKKGFKVVVVDQSVVGADELVDGLHPTDAGYARMGDIWFEAVDAMSRSGMITEP